MEEKLERLRQKDKEAAASVAELESVPPRNGGQGPAESAPWGEEEEPRPRTPDDDWHEESPTRAPPKPDVVKMPEAKPGTVCATNESYL